MMALSCVAVLWYFWEEWALKWSGSQVKSFCISLDQTQNRVSKICLMTKWEENELPMCYQKQSWELQNLSLLSLCNEIFANSHARRSVTREVWDQIRRGAAVRSTYWQISGLSPSDSWKEHALTRVKQAKWSDILHTLWVNECLWDLSLFEPLTPSPPTPYAVFLYVLLLLLLLLFRQQSSRILLSKQFLFKNTKLIFGFGIYEQFWSLLRLLSI